MTVVTFNNWPFLIAFVLLSGFACNKNNQMPSEKEEVFWPVASPEEKGLDGNLLEEAGLRAAQLENSYALLVARDGALVYEQYMRGRDHRSLLHLRSITKNMTGLLAGIAVEEGKLRREDLILEYFSDLPVATPHASWDSVTVDHLLNMLSGIQWDERTEVVSWLTNEYEPLENLFTREFSWEPGEQFNYSTAAVDLLGYVLEAATGTPLETYSFTRLAEPLGIENFEWERDLNGKVRAGTGLQLRPRDLAKVGLLFLQEGQWKNRQIVPREWVRRIRENSIPLSQFYPNLTDLSYQSLWWSDKVGDHRAYYGLGFGGQMLMSIPALELIIVSHHEHFVSFPKAEQQQTAFLREVFPLIIEAAE